MKSGDLGLMRSFGAGGLKDVLFLPNATDGAPR